ncbi:CC_3452 family protein [Phenylobacterium sp.]|jgi:hypothetical protein|uniref:CC_3452 family protein n=1 Tax=Phenylobacterium sp. TaxID=1871053 RepID=UPI002F92034C
MQKFSVLGAIAAMATMASGAAYAQSASSEARLTSPVTAPQEAVIAGVAWRCEGDACLGAGHKANVDGLVRECKKVVAVVGPVASYKSRGRDLTIGQLRACNKAAVQIQTARN